MKKFLLTLSALCICICTFAQMKIVTKGKKLSDVCLKETKVILTGDIVLDDIIKSGVRMAWNLNKYEFCSGAELESIRDRDDLYFLFVSEKKGSEGIYDLTFTKGYSNPTEICRFPISSSESLYERLHLFMPVAVGIIQDYTMRYIESGWFISMKNGKLGKTSSIPLYISENDMAENLSDKERSKCDKKHIEIVKENDIENEFYDDGDGLMGFVISSSREHGQCYKIVIGISDFKLYYFAGHKITDKKPAGFLRSDIKKIYRSR